MGRLRISALAWSLLAGLAGPGAAQETATQSCVDVRIGDERYFTCLNSLLRESVPQHRAPQIEAPLTATSPSTAVGTFNEQAVRQMLGNNFGRSVQPQRLPDAAAGLPTPFVRNGGAGGR
jgi:hypothetical protein